jgi:hypothetical protein
MGQMYHYSNERFGRIKKSSFLHGKTWYMGNTVLKSSRTIILLFKIKYLSHHYIHITLTEFILKYYRQLHKPYWNIHTFRLKEMLTVVHNKITFSGM